MRAFADKLARHGYILAVVAVSAATLVFIPGRDVFAKGQWAILYLLVVVLVASVSGTGPAILASILAFFAWNFFLLPPYHTLRIHDDKDLLSLVAFLVVGVVMGLQTGRLRDREERAVAREREAAAISRLSTYLVSEVSTATVVDTLLTQTVRLLGAGEARLFLPDGAGVLRPAGAAPDGAPPPSDDIVAAASWAWENNETLGLPQASGEHLAPDGGAERAARPPVTGVGRRLGHVRAPARGHRRTGSPVRHGDRGRSRSIWSRSPVWCAHWPTSPRPSSSDSGCRRK